MAATSSNNNNNNAIVFVLLHVSFGISYFLTAQKIMDFQLLLPNTMQVPGLVYLADVMSAVVTKWVVSVGGSGKEKKEQKKKKSAAKERRRPWQFYALPVAEFVGLTHAIRAMETCGGPLYQTLAGMQIPMTVLFSSALLKKKYTVGQLMGVSVVICGLAVKASEVLGADAGSTTSTATIPVVGVLCAFISGISYSMRGILMEYLSKSTKNPPSGDEMSFAMGTFGLAAFAAYTLLVTVPNKEEWVLKPMRKSLAANAVPVIVFFYVANACARAMMAKCMMKIVRSSGATALSLSNATRSVGVIVFTHVAFCSANAKKQCLSQTGAISAALVVSGGLVYAYQTSIAKSSGSGASAKSKKSNAQPAAAKPTRSSARVAAAAKSETIRKRR
jgi:drug/metabolite transporter (DMT)-like permease